MLSDRIEVPRLLITTIIDNGSQTLLNIRHRSFASVA